MKWFSMGVIMVYISELETTLSLDEVETEEFKYTPRPCHKINKQHTGETHRWRRLYTSNLMMRLSEWWKLFYSKRKRSLR
jgi:hypothetical protein